MKKIFTSLAVVFTAVTFFGQIITQNSTPNTVSTTGSVACGNNANGYTADNYYSRVFKLSDYGITSDFKITNVAFGVQTASTDFEATLNIYNLTSGTYPSGTTNLLTTAQVPITTSDAGGMVNSGTSINQVITAGSSFVVEIFHDGSTNIEMFYMGTHPGTQTGLSYLKSTTCGLSTPIATGTGALASFATARWVMTITGENALGVTEVINSKDLQVFPNPVKDVLNFKLSNGLKAESVELYDLLGRNIKTSSAKTSEGWNLSGFEKGVYILKVKANDGKIYIQKIIKE